MRIKDAKYKSEQEDIIQNIINILELDDEKSITLYQLDKDVDKQKKIIDLMPDIRKYFSYIVVKGVQRQYLSIIRQVVKRCYNMYSIDFKTTIDNKTIRTKKYIFVRK